MFASVSIDCRSMFDRCSIEEREAVDEEDWRKLGGGLDEDRRRIGDRCLIDFDRFSCQPVLRKSRAADCVKTMPWSLLGHWKCEEPMLVPF